MSIQFIAGVSGSGKSHYIYEKIIQESMEHPERNYLVIVPEQFTMVTEKELASLHPRRAILNVNVLSFHRLAWRVFGEVGGCSRPVLEETGKSLVLQKVIWDRKKELKVLGSAMQKPGAVSRMKSLISELLQYQVRPEDLEGWAEEQGQKKLLAWKLQDVRTVYQGFEEYLSRKYLTVEEVPEVLCSVIGKSELIRGSTVVLDGFMGFTPVQLQVVRQLCSLCGKVYVVVTADPREDIYRKDRPHRLFHVSAQMIRQVSEIAGDAGAEILPVDWVTPGKRSRFADNPALHFLEQNLFRYGKKSYPGGQEAISLGEADSPAEELARAAETILRLIREEGYRYRDFAVVTGDLEEYGREAERIFHSAGIPFFLDQKHDVMLNPFVEFVRAAVDMAVQNCSYESVFRFLRCGLTDFTEGETDRMENYVLALGIRSRKQYREKWIRLPRYMKPEDIGELNALRKRFVEETEEFLDGIKERMAPAERRTEVLYRFIIRHNIQRKLKNREERLRAEGKAALAREYAQMYRIVMDLLDKMAEVLGGEKTGLTAYQQILEAGLQEARVGLIPPGGDQVLVGDIERTRLKNIRVLFLVGVNEGIIPRRVNGAGILSEADREYLQKKNISLSPTAREEMYRQRFYLYLSLTKPSDRLYLSFSRGDAGDGARMPSYLIGVLLRLFPDIRVRRLEEERTVQDRLETPEGMMELFLKGLRSLRSGGKSEDRAEGCGGPGEQRGFPELYRWYQSDETRRKELDRLLEAVFYENPQTGISRAVAKALYGRVLTGSATRLEQFAACAFAHFLKYGLLLKEREKYEFSAADMGNIMHETLERFAYKASEKQLRWADLEDGQRETLVDEALDEIVHDYGNTILHSSRRNTWLIGRARSILHCTVWALQEQLRRGAFEPEGVELSFAGEEQLRAVNIALSEDEKIRLRGRIDRMDVCESEGKLYVRVIDYKTGGTVLDLQALYCGLQLQLAVYLNAAVELEQKKHPDRQVEPAGIYYYHIEDPYLRADTLEEEDNPERRLQELQLNGLSRREAEIIRLQDETLKPSEESRVIPVKLNKDGSLSRTSKTAGKESFDLIRRYADRKIRELGRQILDGHAEIAPAVLKEQDSCTYCPYHGICGFDERIPGFSRRRIRKLAEEELLQRMAGEDGKEGPEAWR